MKKFLCVMSIFILLFLVFFSFVACNTVYKQEIVNEKQWKDVFVNSLSSTRYSIYETLNTTNSTNPIISYSANYIYDRAKFYAYMSQIIKFNENSEIIYRNYQSYFVVNGQDYITYTSNLSPNSENVTWSPYSRHCSSEQLAQGLFVNEADYLAKLVVPFGIGNLSEKFSDFTFDSSNNSYVAEFNTEAISINYVIIFENEKISKINYIQSVSSNDSAVYDGNYEYNIVISYD